MATIPNGINGINGIKPQIPAAARFPELPGAGAASFRSIDLDVCAPSVATGTEKTSFHPGRRTQGFCAREYLCDKSRYILVGGLEHVLFSHILRIIIPID